MPYKDKTKDREAHKELMRKRREGVTTQGVTGAGVTQCITFEDGSVLDINNLLDHKEKLTQLIKYIKGEDKFRRHLEDIRFGVYGPTLKTIDLVLETIS